MDFELTRFDSADYLDTDEAIRVHLEEALETDDPAFIAQAPGTVARARGMSAQGCPDPTGPTWVRLLRSTGRECARRGGDRRGRV